MTLALLYMGMLAFGAALTPGVGMAGSLLGLCPQAVTNLSHVPAYALLTWVIANGLRGWASSERIALAFAVTVAMIFGLSMEVMQAYVPGRFAEGGDVLSDAVGIGLAALVMRSAPDRSLYARALRRSKK